MRQIEDKWRPDVNESNYMQIMKNLMGSYQFTNEDNQSIDSYFRHSARKVFTQKCSTSCLNAKESDYNNCVISCLNKYISAVKQFDTVNSEFEEKLAIYQTSGKDFFKA
jgi:conjugal transfer/entry exclusion protein